MFYHLTEWVAVSTHWPYSVHATQNRPGETGYCRNLYQLVPPFCPILFNYWWCLPLLLSNVTPWRSCLTPLMYGIIPMFCQTRRETLWPKHAHTIIPPSHAINTDQIQTTTTHWFSSFFFHEWTSSTPSCLVTEVKLTLQGQVDCELARNGGHVSFENCRYVTWSRGMSHLSAIFNF